VDGLEQQYGSQLVVKRINAVEGDGPAIMRGYRVQGHPTVLMFDSEGRETGRVIGSQPAAEIEAVLKEAL
jgi:thioredoxin-related protein